MEFIEHFYDSVCDRSCSHIDSSPLLIESIRESTIQMINLQSIKSPALNQFKKNIRIFHKNRMQFFVMRNKWGQQTCNVSPPSVNDFVLVLEFDPSVSSEQKQKLHASINVRVHKSSKRCQWACTSATSCIQLLFWHSQIPCYIACCFQTINYVWILIGWFTQRSNL